jgi:hypothetical protein
MVKCILKYGGSILLILQGGNLLFYHTQQLKSELLPKFDQNVSSKHSWSCVFIVKQVSIFLC